MQAVDLLLLPVLLQLLLAQHRPHSAVVPDNADRFVCRPSVGPQKINHSYMHASQEDADSCIILNLLVTLLSSVFCTIC